MMNTVTILMKLDAIAREANALWHSCETLKMQIAKDSGISDENLRARGIHVPDKKALKEG